MEGIHRDYLMFDFVLQSNWGRSPGLAANSSCSTECDPNGCHGPGGPECDVSVRGWASAYGRRRYGTAGGTAAAKIWEALFDVAYRQGSASTGAVAAAFSARPTLCMTPCTAGPGASGIALAGDKSIARHEAVCSVKGSSAAVCGCQCPPIFKAGNRSTWGAIFDSNATLFVPAWRQLLKLGKASPAVAASRAFRFDLVNVERQVLSDKFQSILLDLRAVVPNGGMPPPPPAPRPPAPPPPVPNRTYAHCGSVLVDIDYDDHLRPGLGGAFTGSIDACCQACAKKVGCAA